MLVEHSHSGLTTSLTFSPFFIFLAAIASALKEPPVFRENSSPPSGDSATTASLPCTLTLYVTAAMSHNTCSYKMESRHSPSDYKGEIR